MSSLDQESRVELVKTIRFQQEYRRITTVIVSHSAETLAECTAIYRFSGGAAEQVRAGEGRHA
jgi:ABC-type lipoprotein export system ATPase subunit